MTGRERINAIMNKKPADRLSWTTIVDNATLSKLPDNIKGMSGIDFYRYIGCDIFLLNCWGMNMDFSSPQLVWSEDTKTNYKYEDGKSIHELKSSKGTLTTIYRNGHPIKYPVSSIDDINIYMQIWENAQFIEHDDNQVYDNINSIIGDDGIVTRFWGPSTIPKLLEYDMGVMNFYCLLNDYPDEMDALISTIHKKELEAFEILAKSPCDVIILCENTSTFYISPDVYRKYNGRHVRDFVDIIHDSGKIAIIHMCGHVKNLLHEIKDTGLDGIHALTPPPTGDTPFELALDVLGDDISIWTLTIENTYNDFVKNQKHVELFKEKMRYLFNRIKVIHGQKTKLNINPAE